MFLNRLSDVIYVLSLKVDELEKAAGTKSNGAPEEA